ncbi:MAG: hypothetical protein NTX25_05635 [Proteobacteria bacterium]|nr:hypothetical protein [Pseudomonadota bacterium]
MGKSCYNILQGISFCSLFCGLFWICWESIALAGNGSEILYMDDEANFLLFDQIPSDIKEGDHVCLFQSEATAPYCEARVRWISRKPLVFTSAAVLAKLQVGNVLEVKRIYLVDKNSTGTTYTDTTSFSKDFLGKAQAQKRSEDIQKEQSEQPKVPKGSAPSLQAEAPAITGGDFPEIFIPKIRKNRTRAKKDTSETAETIAAIKKALKDKASSSYQFLPTRQELTVVHEEVQAPTRSEDEIPPSPLHQAIDYNVFQTIPILPVASFQSLRFRTVSSDSLERNSLWVKNNGSLKSTLGSGFSLNLLQNLNQIFSFGWRYHVYERASSRATYDDIDDRFEARTSTRISSQAVHAAMGWRRELTDYLLFDQSFGLDFYYTELWFKALNVDTSTDRSEAIGFARSSFFFLAPRWQTSLRLQYHAWGISLSSVLEVPMLSFNRNFEGSAAKPDRLIYSQDFQRDLQNSLTHKIRPIGLEILLGMTYQPQRD